LLFNVYKDMRNIHVLEIEMQTVTMRTIERLFVVMRAPLVAQGGQDEVLGRRDGRGGLLHVAEVGVDFYDVESAKISARVTVFKQRHPLAQRQAAAD
jgi:hypothetical protein